MPDFSSVSLPAPKDWPAFERAMRLLFEYSLNDPQVQNNGRSGQRQYGVDVFGNRNGGDGPQVGIQCKGKDADFGRAVSENELKAEVHKTKKFKPSLKEFILVTTAPDDEKIQRAARLLAQKVRKEGRDLTIAVWGWSRVQQEIAKFPEVLRGLHPDYTPFTGQIIDQTNQILELLRRQAVPAMGGDDQRQGAVSALATTQIAIEQHVVSDNLDKHLHEQIDTYRDYIINNRPRTALELLNKLKDRIWPSSAARIKFRLTANIGAAYHRLAEYEKAADYFLEAATHSPDEIPAISNKIVALLIKNRDSEAHELAKHAIAIHPENPDISLQRLQARSAGETVESLWPTLNQKVQEDPNLIAYRLLVRREAQDVSWRDLDSPALRSLVAAAANADRRSILRSLLDSIPPELKRIPFYRGARIAYFGRVGDIRAGEQEIRAYISDRPRSLEMHLQLLGALYRQDKIEALRGEVAKAATLFDGAPADFMKLAQFKDDFGDWREAHALAYGKLLSHSKDPAVSMGYIGVFLRIGHSTELEVSPGVADANCAVEIRGMDGRLSVFVIEPNEALRPAANYLSPEHKMAQALLGQAANGSIVLPDGHRATITSIKPKELHALHDLLENFQNVFPDAQGFERVYIDSKSPEGLEPIAERLKERHDAIDNVSKLYSTGQMPLALAARVLGSDPVDTLIGFGQSNRDVLVAKGTHIERNTAIAAVDANGAKGCVVDAITLHVIRRLDLADVVVAMCGPIHTVDRTRFRFQAKIAELRERIDEPDVSLSWDNGKVYRNETSVDQKKQALAQYEEDEKWLLSNATIIPADGTRDPSADIRQLMKRFGSGFVDELRAAQSSGFLFVSEDLPLRALAQAEFSVPSTWLQPMLMSALAKGKIGADDYRKAITTFIDAHFTFISVDASLLVQSVRGLNKIEVPADFSKLASRLGGKAADLPSHLNVAYGTIQQTWQDSSIPYTARKALVGNLLENLIKERPGQQIFFILGLVREFGQKVLNDMRFEQYLYDWMAGHFLQLIDT